MADLRFELTRRQRRSLLVVAVALIGVAGCGGGPDGAASTPDAVEMQACTVLTTAEVTAVIGQHDGGFGSGGHCSWKNTDTYSSITVTIGSPGTGDGSLPDLLPGAVVENGPEGIRFSSGNIADFLVGDRLGEIQVVTSTSDHRDQPIAARLISLIRARVST